VRVRSALFKEVLLHTLKRKQWDTRPRSDTKRKSRHKGSPLPLMRNAKWYEGMNPKWTNPQEEQS